MTDKAGPKIGFLARNRFQYLHCQHIIAYCNAPVICRPKLAEELRQEFGGLNVYAWRKPWWCLDGEFDVLVAQGNFDRSEDMKQTKIAHMQYGYAKAPYNFGPMRAFADLHLGYGEYAVEKFERYAPSIAVGHPWAEAAKDPHTIANMINERAKIFPQDRPLILYAPTWGDLSSLPDWAEQVASLGDRYNVLLKPHHNSLKSFGHLLETLETNTVKIVQGGASLLSWISVSDLAISDQSGAIFDALLLECPLVLIGDDSANVLSSKKQDKESLEIAYRTELGYVVTRRADLDGVVAKALEEGPKNSKISGQLHMPAAGTLDRMRAALVGLAAGQFRPTAEQRAISEPIKAKQRRKRKNKSILMGLVLMALIALLYLIFTALM